MTATVSNAVILERIENLQEDMKELAARVQCWSDGQSAFREQYLVGHAQVVRQAEKAHERIDAMQTQIEIFERRLKDMEKLAPMMKAISYLLIGLSIPMIISLGNLVYMILAHKVILP